jgi:outer membrane usher protein
MDALRALSASVLLLCLCAAAVAAQIQRVPLSVVVNTQPKADVVAWMDEAGELWVSVADLKLWGLTVAAKKTLDGTPAVPLKSLGGTVSFDEAQLRLVVDIAASAELGSTRIDLRPPKLVTPELLRTNGLRFDYEVGAGRYGATSSLDANLTTRARLSDWQILDERSLATIEGRFEQSYARTTLRRDFPEQALRLDVGALATPSSGYLPWSTWTGISIGTVYGMDPRASITSTAKLDALVKYPSTADVYVNGVKQGSFAVGPGRLDLEGIRGSTGAAQVRVVLRDLYGGETVLEDTRYLSQDVVQQGIHDYHYQLGLDAYAKDEQPLGIRGSHRYGLGENLTVGARFLLSSNEQSAQVDAIYQHAGWGAFGLSAVRAQSSIGSQTSPLSGFAVNHEYRAAKWTLQSGLSKLPALTPDGYRSTSRSFARASFETGTRGQWLVGTYRQSDLQRETRTGIELGWSKHLGSSVMAHVNVARDSLLGTQARAWLVWSLGDNRTASALVDSGRGRQQTELTYSQSASEWEEAAWRVGVRSQNSETGSRLSYEKGTGPFMLRGQFASLGHSTSMRASAQGALLVDGSTLGLARSRGDAAVLVETPGLGNVRIYRNGMLAGRTDKEGKLWVSGLVSYDEARLSIDENDVPLDQWYLPANTLRTRPAPGAVAKVGFDLRKIQSFELEVLLCQGTDAVCTPAQDLSMQVSSDLGTQHQVNAKEGRALLEYAIEGQYAVSARNGKCLASVELTRQNAKTPVRLQCL